MATSTGPTLHHFVHQASPEERTDASNLSESGLGPPPTLGGRAISPTSHSHSEGTSGNIESVNWGVAEAPASPMMVPTFPTKATGNPVVIASSGIRVPNTNVAASPTFSMGSTKPTSPRTPSTTTKTRRGKGGGDSSAKSKDGNGKNPNRRQKRLERNRESARLSRRRRKQYLEVLEERVTKLSLEMDKGRREHVARSLDTINAKREHVLANGGLGVGLLGSALSRTSTELRVAVTFQTQQLHSLSLPPSVKFLLWLTLENDSYFRGGRAASERLSAARIGERMLSSGNDRVPPSHGMWLLLCHEVGLSYDQEERVRNFQRSLILTPESWLHRHTGAASKLAVDSTHDSLQAAMHRVGHREQSILNCLSQEQQLKFLAWASKNSERLSRLNAKRSSFVPKQEASYGAPELSDSYHPAANLYILNHRMQNVLQSLHPAPALVSARSLQRLSRRPSFESLGSSSSLTDKNKEGSNRPLSREVSFSSEGSLKRPLDDTSSVDQDEEDRHTIHNINPEEAQTEAGPTIEAALGFIKELVPPPKPTPKAPSPETVTSNYVMPPSFKPQGTYRASQGLSHPGAPQTYAEQPQQQQYATQTLATQTIGGSTGLSPLAATVTYVDDQSGIPSFLPPNLNSVPEEGFLPGSGSAEDFLFDLTAEDWAIGAGLDMDET